MSFAVYVLQENDHELRDVLGVYRTLDGAKAGIPGAKWVDDVPGESWDGLIRGNWVRIEHNEVLP